MEITKREQITQTITERLIFHTINLAGVKYSRVETFKVVIPFVGEDIQEAKTSINWKRYIGKNTLTVLSKKEAKDLNLEGMFQKLSMKEKHVIDY